MVKRENGRRRPLKPGRPKRAGTHSFRKFVAACRKHLGFLAEYGFGKPHLVYLPLEYSVSFKSETARVIVVYEARDAPCFLIEDLGARRRLMALDFILKKRCPDGVPKPSDSRDFEDKDLEPLMDLYASLLREHCQDVLMGDFTLVNSYYRRQRPGTARKSR